MAEKDWFYWVASIANYAGMIVEIPFIIFLTVEFTKRKSELQGAYYYILYISYVVDGIANCTWAWGEIINYPIGNVGTAVSYIYKWYFYFSPGIWSFSLGLNRCTALAFPVMHNTLWKHNIKYILIFIVLFPFIVNGYSFSNLWCRMYINDPACAEYQLTFVMTGIIVNTSLAIGTLLIIIYGIIKSPKVVDASTRAKIERKLIIHTCAQSIMLICWFGSIYLSIGLPNLSDEMFTFLDTLSTFLFFMQHYPPMLLPLFLNPIFRNSFFKFIGLGKVIKIENVSISRASRTAFTRVT